jgi:hypothetical protein
MSGSDLSRRELVRAARAVASDGDAGWLRRLVGFEQLMEATYDQALSSGALTGASESVARTLRDQERAHAQRLIELTGRRGLPAFPRTRRQVQSLLRAANVAGSLDAMSSERSWMTLLEDGELMLQGACWQTVEMIRDGDAALLVCEILASEAQHLSLLFLARHPADVDLAVSAALIEGAPPPKTLLR